MYPLGQIIYNSTQENRKKEKRNQTFLKGTHKIPIRVHIYFHFAENLKKK